MYILAIESSHDDTSLVVYHKKKIVWEKNISQINIHQKYGGTIPELAARNHVDNFGVILEKLKTEFDLNKLSLIAYTHSPGLKGSLQVGYLLANAFSRALDLPLKPINHMHGHIMAIEFTKQIIFPSLALIISGGHSQLWYLKSYVDIELIGQTLDDAIGEVFDKVARFLNIGYPGGPIIDKLTSLYNGELIDFNLNLLPDFKMSFSGLKTKIKDYINRHNKKDLDVNKIAASFQLLIVNYFREYMDNAIDKFKPNSIILGGGVSANSHIRKMFLKCHKNALIPDLRYTTDNAAMIAITADLQK
ncbi:MAG: tRNA (adenosine(37)-N6)-threonylcarbamoyltransferase complex transferase subunit TsaD [Mycoplasma sp.]|nr:tRNA (adenosine(37)-N6)-threonylcarbamoyltransferase complex transferase subunit TsaD [Mycoplasma sp.]